MAGKTIGELNETLSLDNSNLLAVSSDGNVLKKTSLETVFGAVEQGIDVNNFTSANKATIAGLAMPSNHKIALTIGNPAGTTYTSIADGYFYAYIAPTTTTNYWFYLYNSTRDIGCSQFMTNIGYTMIGYVPACQGDSVVLNMRMDGATQYYGCNFIYAVGSEPEA